MRRKYNYGRIRRRRTGRRMRGSRVRFGRGGMR